MYVQSQGDLAYLAHPRTASRATRDALGQRGFILQGSHHSGPPESALNGRRAFCVVRNHWDTIVSWYFNFNNNAGKPLTGKWIRQWTGQNKNYFKPEGLFWYTYLNPQPIILRYENLQQELDTLLEANGIKPIKLQVVGASTYRKGVHYRDIHSEETAAVVRDLWGHEIDALGYEY